MDTNGLVSRYKCRYRKANVSLPMCRWLLKVKKGLCEIHEFFVLPLFCKPCMLHGFVLESNMDDRQEKSLTHSQKGSKRQFTSLQFIDFSVFLLKYCILLVHFIRIQLEVGDFLWTLGVAFGVSSVKQLQDKWHAKQDEEGLDEVVACGHGCALNMHYYILFSIKFIGRKAGQMDAKSVPIHT